MKKITIGIPRALYYHKYGVLWKNFFNYLGCRVVLSPETSMEILAVSPHDNINCTPYKIYYGHISYLKDRCDYILITTICDYSKKEKVCPKMHSIRDNVNSINREQILNLHINHKKMRYHSLELLILALKITRNPVKIIYSYFKAKKKQKNYNTTKLNENTNKLSRNSKKVLLISHSYILHDTYLMTSIIETLKTNNIDYIYSDYLEYKIASYFSKYFSNNLNYIYSKETTGSLYYYKYQVDGIIIITDKNCNLDKNLIPKAIDKNGDTQIINIHIDNYCKELDDYVNKLKNKK